MERGRARVSVKKKELLKYKANKPFYQLQILETPYTMFRKREIEGENHKQKDKDQERV